MLEYSMLHPQDNATRTAIRLDGNRKGIFTRQRQPKEAAFFLKRRWEALPADYKA